MSELRRNSVSTPSAGYASLPGISLDLIALDVEIAALGSYRLLAI